ncbi:hypothetical protein LTR66_008419 [Elasticomyces elasticus]|nr:hypothetical protein LTR66_008419 [Elasticomyces elasticus]
MSDSSSDASRLIQLREAVPAQPADPSTVFSGSERSTIYFRHPGYPQFARQNILLKLYAFDNLLRGLHYGVAHTACAMVACNAWNGYFTTLEGQRVDLQADDLLTAENYYFQIPGQENTRYPVYPNFAHWAFPHDDLPPNWPDELDDDAENSSPPRPPPSASGISQAVQRRDDGCLITHHHDFLQTAHLCPRAELRWFRENSLSDYNLNKSLQGNNIIEDVSNAIALRMDLHKAFDDKRTLGALYHNTPLKLKRGISTKCLLVRFAWAIFPGVADFLTRGPGRKIKVRVKRERNGSHDFEEETRELGEEEAQKLIGITEGGRGTKRKNSTRTQIQEGELHLLQAMPPSPQSISQRRRKRRRLLSLMPPHTSAITTEHEQLANSPPTEVSSQPSAPQSHCGYSTKLLNVPEDEGDDAAVIEDRLLNSVSSSLVAAIPICDSTPTSSVNSISNSHHDGLHGHFPTGSPSAAGTSVAISTASREPTAEAASYTEAARSATGAIPRLDRAALAAERKRRLQEKEHFDALRLKWLQRQRPDPSASPELFCCDYWKAERAANEETEARLCRQCLGDEYSEDGP